MSVNCCHGRTLLYVAQTNVDHLHSDSVARWVVFSCVWVCLGVCVSTFVNTVTLEQYEVLS